MSRRRAPALLALLLGACARWPLPAPATEHLDAETRRAALPSILPLSAGLGEGTAFACVAPGLACTAGHVVGSHARVTVQVRGQRGIEVPVLKKHPLDDVALLDIRGLPGPPPPLPVSSLDVPPEGLLVCRIGYPPRQSKPLVRCDPIGRVILESAPRVDGAVLPRIVHLGVGLKGDSGGPLYDPQTGLVVGMHIAESNGAGRAATAAAILDLVQDLERKHPWVRACVTGPGASLGTLAHRLRCPDLGPRARAEILRRVGERLLALGRRGEALSAFDEALGVHPEDGLSWLWRALVFPISSHARDDAAFAFRLSPSLRQESELSRHFAGPLRQMAQSLRDAVAPVGVRLATIVGPGGCDACPTFCEAARRAPRLRLWAVDDANHPAAEAWLRRRIAKAPAGAVLLAVDGRASAGCGTLHP